MNLMIRAVVESDLAARRRVVHELALPPEAAVAALVHQRHGHGARQHVLATCKRRSCNGVRRKLAVYSCTQTGFQFQAR